MTLYDFAKENCPELPEQWHPEKNGSLTPQDVTYGSKRKVWWRCERGHDWQAMVANRTRNGTGCPYCAGKKVLPGFNDLRTRNPSLAAQWHPTKNGDLSPEIVNPGSGQKAWWQCGRGHEWQAVVKSRAEGAGCPVCSNQVVLLGENDLASTRPELAAEWHPTKNKALTPENVTAGSAKKVWWQCPDGHEWRAMISARSGKNSGCPVCAGKKIIPGVNDLATHFPEVSAQWHSEKNGALRPDQVSPNSNRYAWWRCDKGHEWRALIFSRTKQGTQCPYCTGRKLLRGFNDLNTRFPLIAAEWHPTLNQDLTACDVTPGSHAKVWWQCAEGHVWKTVVYSRTGPMKHGCPICAGRVKQDKKRFYDELDYAFKKEKRGSRGA